MAEQLRNLPGRAGHGPDGHGNDNSPPFRDQSRFWVVRELGNLECMHTRFRTHCFAPHTHETYVLGHIVRGYQNYRNKGVERIWGAGSSLIINPDDLHDCRPGEAGSEYRTLYPSDAMMRGIVEGLWERQGASPHFKLPQVEDAQFSSMFANLHGLLDEGGEALEQESRLLEVLAHLVRFHSDGGGNTGRGLPVIGDEGRMVREICDYMNDNLADDLGLEDLAGLVGVSQYRLIRTFRKVMGVNPHAYRMNRRVTKARLLLSEGKGLAETALSCGFYDQAHFSKIFKRTIGVTPKTYQMAFLQ